MYVLKPHEDFNLEHLPVDEMKTGCLPRGNTAKITKLSSGRITRRRYRRLRIVQDRSERLVSTGEEKRNPICKWEIIRPVHSARLEKETF